MFEIIAAVVGVILGLLGFTYGAKQKQKAKEADNRSEGLADAYDDLVERQKNTVEEVADVADRNKQTGKEREEGKSAPVSSSDVDSRLERLRQ